MATKFPGYRESKRESASEERRESKGLQKHEMSRGMEKKHKSMPKKAGGRKGC